jgi:biopolymer transport protein ExbB
MSKPSNATASAKTNSGPGIASTLTAFLVIVALLIISELIFAFIFGAKENFEGGDPVKGHPIQEGFRSWLGTIYKGGPIVPLLFTAFLTAISFSIERAITIFSSQGKGNVANFVRKVKAMINGGNIDGAIAECDKQKGSVANVIRSGLVKYKEMEADTNMDKEQKVLAISQELEESTALEMPILERNLPILSTIASVGTLIALLGTVIGMIKSFKALATSGAPDAVALSTGISEALINTALGIATSALAIILYNFFTSRVDSTNYQIEEAGFSITQSFAAHH